jgi:hypothetical protein
MDRSSDLVRCFDAAVSQMNPARLGALRTDREKRVRQQRPPANPFADALAGLVASAERGCSEAHDRVCQTFAVLDDPAAEQEARDALDEGLVLADATLLAVATAVKQLTGTVDKAAVLMKNRPAPFVEHTRSALGLVAQRVGDSRISVALAREEADEHAATLFKLRKAGVVALDDAIIEHVVAPSPLEQRAADAAAAASKGAAKDGGGSKTQSINKAFKGVMRLTDKVVSMSTHAATKGFRATAASSAASASESAARLRADASSVSRAVDDLAEADRSALETEHVALLAAQEHSSAHAAKEIEASVRSLSVLTTIMNEQVALQGEQLLTIERDAKASQESLEKAGQELDKPLRETWNAKRLLAAVLCVFAVLLLLLDGIVR